MSDIYAGAAAETTVTGDAVTLDLAAASVATRLLSGLIDVLLAVVLLAGGLTMTAFTAPTDALAGVGGVLSLVLAFLVLPVTVETATRGRSAGKAALGLRTVRDDGGPVSFHHVFTRHLVGVAEIWVLSGVPALLTALLHPRGKRVGDVAAGTYVVRDRFRLRLSPPPAMPPHLAAWASAADLAPLPDGTALAIRGLLQRDGSLAPGQRDLLAAELAEQVRPLVSPAPPAGTTAPDFLAAVSAERRRRDGERLARQQAQRQRLASS
ncbi:RDD family protein [Nocardioidaceae bacterium]|nr:RDD family protein [Nocardioidaceae bacterium]